MIWLIDACVLMRADEAGVLREMLQAHPVVPFAITAAVYNEVANPNSTKAQTIGRARKAKDVLDKSGCEILSEIGLETPAARIYAWLRARRSSAADGGECACIAVAATDARYTFVTSEKAAAYLALRELGGRVQALPWFLRHLVDLGVMARDVADRIVRQDRTPVPTWWEGWLGPPPST